MSKKATAQDEEIVIGFRIPRSRMPVVRRLAKQLGYKSLSYWLRSMFDRELTKELEKLVPENESAESSKSAE